MSEQYIYVLKLETDSTTPNVACCGSLFNITTNQMMRFGQPAGEPVRLCAEIAALADGVVVHTQFAIRAFAKLYGITIDPSKVIDAHLIAKARAPHVTGGHGLQEWAARLKIARTPFRGATVWSPTAQAHCDRDALIIAELYHYLSGAQ